MNLEKFLVKHAVELAALGNALHILADGVGLQPSEKASVTRAAALAITGAENIAAAVKEYKGASKKAPKDPATSSAI